MTAPVISFAEASLGKPSSFISECLLIDKQLKRNVEEFINTVNVRFNFQIAWKKCFLSAFC